MTEKRNKRMYLAANAKIGDVVKTKKGDLIVEKVEKEATGGLKITFRKGGAEARNLVRTFKKGKKFESK